MCASIKWKKKHTSQRTNFEISLAQASHCIIHQLHLESTCVCIFLFIRVRVSVCAFFPHFVRVFENVVWIAFGYCFKLKVSLERAKVRLIHNYAGWMVHDIQQSIPCNVIPSRVISLDGRWKCCSISSSTLSLTNLVADLIRINTHETMSCVMNSNVNLRGMSVFPSLLVCAFCLYFREVVFYFTWFNCTLNGFVIFSFPLDIFLNISWDNQWV